MEALGMVKRLIGAAVILAIVGVVVTWRLSMNAGVRPAAAQVGGQAIPVTAGTVAVEDIPVFLHGIGTVQAYNTVAIKSRVDGQIVKINFKEGEEVKAGDPLFQIDPRPYQAALETAQAAKEK
ncbi:MAG: biotin/lipoyl-binding protein, partial [Alphaproteobacteria bacterium]|nr:biotin/lipoyl-binding protein [Alphaproteobacteria bacterium]